MARVVKPLEAAMRRGDTSFDEAHLRDDVVRYAKQYNEISDFRKASLERLKQALAEIRQALSDDLTKTQDGARYVGAYALAMDKLITILVHDVAMHLVARPHAKRWAVMATRAMAGVKWPLLVM